MVLSEIIIKRMDAHAKMAHLTSLQVVPFLGEAVSGLQITPRFAGLVAALALELLDCWDRLSSATPQTVESATLLPGAVEMLRQVMPLLLQCLASSDMETSQATLGFLHSYVIRLRKLLPSPRELSAHEPDLQNLLLVMGQKSIHPADFDFDEPDEAEEAFNAYRREVRGGPTHPPS